MEMEMAKMFLFFFYIYEACREGRQFEVLGIIDLGVQWVSLCEILSLYMFKLLGLLQSNVLYTIYIRKTSIKKYNIYIREGNIICI